MKKKTIKSYFFNSNYRNKSISTLFSFSKRAVKYRKQLNHFLIPNKYIKNKNYVIKTSNIYKHYVIHVILYSQWIAISTLLVNFFLRSFYKKFFTKEPTMYGDLFLWYLLKKTFTVDFYKNIKIYPTTGMLSSHFVHFLSKKNLTYQTRSKYRSDTFNMNNIHHYIYVYTHFIKMYIHLLNFKLYFFTNNTMKKNFLVDSDFNSKFTNWSCYTNNSFNNTTGTINSTDYKLADYTEIFEKKELILSYFRENDIQKKELLFQMLNLSNDNIIDIIQHSQSFLNYNYKTYYNYNLDLKYVFNTSIFYKVY